MQAAAEVEVQLVSLPAVLIMEALVDTIRVVLQEEQHQVLVVLMGATTLMQVHRAQLIEAAAEVAAAEII
jgi:hypothetical protein